MNIIKVENKIEIIYGSYLNEMVNKVSKSDLCWSNLFTSYLWILFPRQAFASLEYMVSKILIFSFLIYFTEHIINDPTVTLIR